MKKSILLLILVGAFACKKTNIQGPPVIANGLYYANGKSGLFVVELITTDSKKVYTGILLAGNVGVRLSLPADITSGRYDVLLSPEGALANSTTEYTVGGLSGSTNKYPIEVPNVYLTVGNTAAVSISVR